MKRNAMTSPVRWMTIMIFIILFLISRPAAAVAVEDAILAVVNDELVTIKDLKDYVQSTYVSLVAEGLSDGQIQTVMKDLEINGIHKLIEDKIMLSRANHIGLQVREDLVTERVENLKAKYGSEQNLVLALIKNGSTLTDLKNKIRDQLKIKYVVENQVRSKIYVNPQEVTEYYEKNKEQFSRSDRINLDSIFIAYGQDKEEAEAKADHVLKLIEEGMDFQQLVKQYSDAPSVGTIERGQLLPEIEKAVFSLGMEEVSAPLKIDAGIFIFKVVGRSHAQIDGLSDVKDKIYDMLFEEKFEKKLTAWLDELKEKAYIEIKQ